MGWGWENGNWENKQSEKLCNIKLSPASKSPANHNPISAFFFLKSEHSNVYFYSCLEAAISAGLSNWQSKPVKKPNFKPGLPSLAHLGSLAPGTAMSGSTDTSSKKWRMKGRKRRGQLHEAIHLTQNTTVRHALQCLHQELRYFQTWLNCSLFFWPSNTPVQIARYSKSTEKSRQ